MADDLNQIKELKKTIQEIEGIFGSLTKHMADFTKMQKISNQIGLISLQLNQDLDEAQLDKIKSIEKELSSMDKITIKKQETNKLSKSSLDMSEQQANELKKQEESEQTLLDLTKQQTAYQKQALRDKEQISSLEEQSRIAQVGIGAEAQNLLNVTGNLTTLQQETKNLMIQQREASEDISESGIVRSKVFSELVNISKSQLGNLVSQADTLDRVKLTEAQIVDVSREKDQLHQIEKAYLADKDKLTKEQQVDIEKVIALKGEELSNQEVYNDKLEKMQGTMKDVGNKFDSSIQKVGSSISNIPGGDFLMKHFKFDEISAGIKENIMGSMTESFSAAGGGAKGMFSALQGGVKAFGMAMITGPQAILFATLAIVGGLVALFMDLDKDVKAYAENMEVSRVEATKMQDSIGDMSRNIGQMGVNTEQVAKTMFELRDAMGGVRLDPSVNKDHAKLIETTTLLNEKYGTTTEEAMNLKSIAMNMGTTQEDLAATMAIYGDKTIGAKKAMQALAKVPKTIASNFKGTTAELAKAVVKAEMLGMSLDKVNSIGDGMLDIESSLQAEMEARVMTGKNISLDKMRELSLAGDIAGMQEELLVQAGSLQEFNDMDKLGKEAMAKALGMSTDEMVDMLTKQEELNELGWDQAKMDKINASSAEDLLKMQQEAIDNGNTAASDKLKQLAAEKESAGLQERFGDALTKIKETMFKLVTPIMEIVNGMFASGDATEKTSDALGGVGDILGVIGKALGGVFSLFKFIFDIAWSIVSGVLGPMFTALGSIKTALDPIFAIFSSLFETTAEGGEETMGFMDGLTKALEVVGNIIGFALVTPIKFIAGMIGFWVKLLSGDVTGALSSIGSLIIDTIMSPFEMFGKLIDSIFGTNIMGFINDIKAFFMETFDAVLGGDGLGGIYDKAMSLLGPFQSVGNLVMDVILAPFKMIYGVGEAIYMMLTGDIMGGLSMIGSTVMDYILTPFNLIWGVVQSIMGGFESMTDLLGGVGDAVSSVGSFLGFGGDEVEKTEEKVSKRKDGALADAATEDKKDVIAAAATGGKVTKGGVAVVGEEGPEVVKLPGSAEVVPNEALGGSSQSSSGQGGASGGSDKQDKVIELLTQIYSEVQKPALIKLGNKFVGEMDSSMGIRRNLRDNFDNQYGSTT